MAALDKGHSVFPHIGCERYVADLDLAALHVRHRSGSWLYITMMLGIAISMFTDVTLVRMVMAWHVRKRKLKVLVIEPFLKFVPERRTSAS